MKSLLNTIDGIGQLEVTYQSTDASLILRLARTSNS